MARRTLNRLSAKEAETLKKRRDAIPMVEVFSCPSMATAGGAGCSCMCAGDGVSSLIWAAAARWRWLRHAPKRRG